MFVARDCCGGRALERRVGLSTRGQRQSPYFMGLAEAVLRYEVRVFIRGEDGGKEAP